MSREKALAKNTAILTFGKICTQFMSFLLLPLYTAILEPEVYGISDLFNSYIYLVIPLFSLMLDQGLFRFLIDCRDNKEKQKTLLSTVLNINLVQIGVYVLVYFVLGRFIKSEYKVFLLVDVIINILINTFMQFSRGIGKTVLYAITSFVSATTLVVSNIILLLVLRIGPWGLFISTVIARSLTLLTVAIGNKVWMYYRPYQFSKKEARRLLRYSIPFVPNQLSWWVIGASDRTIISYFIGVAANGLYSVANKFSSIFITFYNIFNLSWTESVSLHINDEDVSDYLKSMINTLFKLFFSVCLGIVAFMPLLFPILINEKYGEAYLQIPILMLAVLFQVIVGLYSVIYVALKKSKEIAKTSFYAAVINIVVDVVLIKYIGLFAASLSTLAAYGIMTIYRYIDVQKYIKVSLDRIWLYICVSAFVCCGYYYNHLWSNIVIAVAMMCFAIFDNRVFIKNILQSATDKIKQFEPF